MIRQNKNRVLIIGNGGREHAFTWKVSQSERVDKIFIAPGNAGTAEEYKSTNVNISSSDIPSLIKFSKEKEINLVIVGPEEPLVNGITDAFTKENILCFGPSAEAARLEGSKEFSKNFMRKYKIPTADYTTFEDSKEAKKYVDGKRYPLVIKADGLAGGKGVLIVENYESALEAIDDLMGKEKFGAGGKKIVIEDFLIGKELSFIIVVDGKQFLPLATSQDHKTIGENDVGLNTGGMGAYSPVSFVNKNLYENIIEKVIKPTVNGLAEEGIYYRGFLYAGLMINNNLEPKVLEYNCRFGDPETQPILMRLKSDLIDMIDESFRGDLNNYLIEWDKRTAIGVVIASEGYPQEYQVGKKILGLEKLNNIDNVKIFHSGTIANNGEVVTNGGRVLCVTGLGEDIIKARKEVYLAVSSIHWDGSYYRKDIGNRSTKNL